MLEQRTQFRADEVFRGHVLDRNAQRYNLTGEIFGVSEGAF